MIHRHRPVTSLKSTEHDAEGAAGYLARAAISGSSRPKSARQPGRDADRVHQTRTRPQSAKSASAAAARGLNAKTLAAATNSSASKMEADAQHRMIKPPVQAVGPMPFSADEKMPSTKVQGSGWNAAWHSATSAGALAGEVQSIANHAQQNVELRHRSEDSVPIFERQLSGKISHKLSLRSQDSINMMISERRTLEPQLSADSRESMHSTAAAPPPGKHTSRPNSAAKSSLAGLQKTHTTSIRELYSEWCVSVRMHAQASALSAVPPALAQRASLSVKALTSSNSAATAFKGPKPVLKPVPGEDGLLEVSRESSNTFSDRLWLDQLRLTRCCVVKTSHPLRMLSYQYNDINKVEHVEDLTDLAFLDFYANSLTSLQGLTQLKGLRVLMLGRNRLTNLSGLQELQSLDVLDVHHNRITCSSPLSHLTSLRILNLSSNCLATLTDLSPLCALAELNIRRNELTSLHFSDTSSISMLHSDAGDAAETASNSDEGHNGAASCHDAGDTPKLNNCSAPGSEETPDELAASVQAAAGAPPNLKRLFASHNKITLLSDIPLLRGLECLQELALDSNPIMTAGHENAARRQILALCPTSLRMLNGSLIAGKEHQLLSLKHQSNCSTHPALTDLHIHAARSKSTRSVRGNSACSTTAVLSPSSSPSRKVKKTASGPHSGVGTSRDVGIVGTPAPGTTGTATTSHKNGPNTSGASSSRTGRVSDGNSSTIGAMGTTLTLKDGKPGVKSSGMSRSKGSQQRSSDWKDAVSLVINGDALHTLKEPTSICVENLTIKKLHRTTVLSPSMRTTLSGMPGLRSLTLCHIGARTLPHLRPLTDLTRLTCLDLSENPVSQLVLFRPFIAAAMPAVMLLNGLAVDVATRDVGHRVVVPLMQFWGVTDSRCPYNDEEGEEGSDRGSPGPSLSHTSGWGLKSVQQMCRTSQADPGRHSEGIELRNHKAKMAGASGGASTMKSDGVEGAAVADIAPEQRRAIERGVDASAARAIEVERRWAELDACWDSVVAEILSEWRSELE